MSEKQAVPREFDRVSRSYDLLSALNPGYSAHLRKSAGRMKLPPNARILDLCCGTGLSTEALREVYPDASITGMDASTGMLEAAREKTHLSDVTWLHGNAMDPAEGGAEGPYDGILVAAAPDGIPPALPEQLDVGGHLVIPIGPGGDQRLVRLTRVESGFEETELARVSFVPLVSGIG